MILGRSFSCGIFCLLTGLLSVVPASAAPKKAAVKDFSGMYVSSYDVGSGTRAGATCSLEQARSSVFNSFIVYQVGKKLTLHGTNEQVVPLKAKGNGFTASGKDLIHLEVKNVTKNSAQIVISEKIKLPDGVSTCLYKFKGKATRYLSTNAPEVKFDFKPYEEPCDISIVDKAVYSAGGDQLLYTRMPDGKIHFIDDFTQEDSSNGESQLRSYSCLLATLVANRARRQVEGKDGVFGAWFTVPNDPAAVPYGCTPNDFTLGVITSVFVKEVFVNGEPILTYEERSASPSMPSCGPGELTPIQLPPNLRVTYAEVYKKTRLLKYQFSTSWTTKGDSTYTGLTLDQLKSTFPVERHPNEFGYEYTIKK